MLILLIHLDMTITVDMQLLQGVNEFVTLGVLEIFIQRML